MEPNTSSPQSGSIVVDSNLISDFDNSVVNSSEIVTSSGSISSVSSSEEDEGFVSGGEEFDTASERPIVAEADDEEEDDVAAYPERPIVAVADEEEEEEDDVADNPVFVKMPVAAVVTEEDEEDGDVAGSGLVGGEIEPGLDGEESGEVAVNGGVGKEGVSSEGSGLGVVGDENELVSIGDGIVEDFIDCDGDKEGESAKLDDDEGLSEILKLEGLETGIEVEKGTQVADKSFENEDVDAKESEIEQPDIDEGLLVNSKGGETEALKSETLQSEVSDTAVEDFVAQSVQADVVESDAVVEPKHVEEREVSPVTPEIVDEKPVVEVLESEDSNVTKGDDEESKNVDVVDIIEAKETELVNGSGQASPVVVNAYNPDDDVAKPLVDTLGGVEVNEKELVNGSVQTSETEKAYNPDDDVAKGGVGHDDGVEVKEAELVNGSIQTSETERAYNPDDDVAKSGVGNDDGVEVKETELVNGSSEASPAVEKAKDSDDDENFEELVKNSTQLIDDVAGSEHAEAVGEEFEDADDRGVNIEEGLDSDEETDGMVFGSSQAAKQFMEELAASGSREIEGQIATDSEEEEQEVDTDGEEGDEKEVFDSAAFAALLKAATGGGGGSEGGNITITSQDGSRLFSIERPAGLGSTVRPAQPMGLGLGRANRSALFAPPAIEAEKELTDEERKKLETLQKLRVKFLRLVQRLGASPEESYAAQVLYRLAVLAGRPNNRAFSLDDAMKSAKELEEEGKDDLDFSINILVIGKCGVGKSSTINSIFGEEKAKVGAFEAGTTSVKEITGVVNGVKIKVIDTPGLKSAVAEQGFNRKVLSSVKRFTKKSPPDIVLYVDRLDTQTRDLNDLPMLKTVTGTLGSATWRNAIVALTHGASAPPDGPNGNPLNYEVSVTQRSHIVQQSIGHAVGDLRMLSPSSMSPVSLIENHPLCRKNRDGQKVLPNGNTWRPQLLLLCYSMKILAEANLVSKPQDPFDHRKLFGFRVRSPPLPYLLSSMLQTRAHPKLPSDQGIDNGDSDADMADFSDSDNEDEEEEYDQLPPFKPLRKAQVDKLSKEQRKAYFEEYDYRVKLLQKKQWREEVKRVKEMKKRQKSGVPEYGYPGDEADQEPEGASPVATPLPDMVLPPTFDSDNPAYRYRFLEPTSQFLARPVLDTHGWDHDCGYDGVNLEQSLAIASKFPANISVQVTKDKKDFSLHLDSSIAAKHGEDGSTMAGFDIQNIGKQLAYIVRGETKFKNLKKNKTAAGVCVTFLGENVATGLKIEDQIALGKQWAVVGSAGTVRCQGDAAYGANFEVQRREIDYPIGQVQSTYGLSLIKWRGDWALGFNSVAQFAIGRNSKVAVRAGINNKLSGQITARTSSSDHLSLVLVGIIPIASAIYKKIWPPAGDTYY